MKPYEECPKFNTCSAPKCPLDPDIDERNKYGEEDKYKVRKATRWAIGKKYPELLKYQGLKGNEFNARGLE